MFSLATASLDACVLPKSRHLWPEIKKKWFVISDDATQLREPGLLKVEVDNAPGNAFIGLSAKCYFLGQENDFKRTLRQIIFYFK